MMERTKGMSIIQTDVLEQNIDNAHAIVINPRMSVTGLLPKR